MGVADPAHYLHNLYLRRELGKLARLNPRRILDAGCGTGDHTLYLARKYPQAEVLGVDINADRIRENQENARRLGIANVRFEAANLCEADFASRFDLVVSIDVLEHIVNQTGALANLSRALKPGGMAFFHIPGIRWYLAGRSPAEAVIRIAKSDPDITLIPDPEDIRPWIWKAAVFICPIIDGGGTRLKILDALAMGKAVVSTTIGCEGLDVKPGEHVLVADGPQEFVRQVLRLLADEASRKQIAVNGRTLVERLYSWEVIGRHLERAYECEPHRTACAEQGSPSPWKA
jgi:SAM-dependent methyltransferase